MNKLYQYKIQSSRNKDLYLYSIEGDIAWMDLYLKGNYHYVEGYYRLPMADPNNNEVYTEFLGSSGKRSVQRFKRLLRNNGAVFEVEKNFSLEERARLHSKGMELMGKILEERKKTN
jgi:hypothetical protein